MMPHHAAQKPRDRLGDDDLAFRLQHPDYLEPEVGKSLIVGIANRGGQEDQGRAALVDIPVARECEYESLPLAPVHEKLFCPEHPATERIDLGPSDETVEPNVQLAHSNR